ncbi:uncharacterized protein LOC131952968 [Physella acuta]|uniref:uncharacterized protein LOC131952968 n=1 Tax=Physella acuta TaxID=109671 RepID=UPI0027DDCA3B|nr:uncharacterized protein LOC131952968 [Physella acuta]
MCAFNKSLFLASILCLVFDTQGAAVSNYFILGVPCYTQSVKQFYLATFSHESFHVDVTLKTKNYDRPFRVLITPILMKKFQLGLYSLDNLESDNVGELYTSLVFTSRPTHMTFSVTMVLVDKVTGYWFDSMLALPVDMLKVEYDVHGLSTHIRQLIIMSTEDYNKITVDSPLGSSYFWLAREEFIVDTSYCGDKDKLESEVFYVYGYYAIGVILATCEIIFEDECNEREIEYHLLESVHPTMKDGNEYIVFSILGRMYPASSTLEDEVSIIPIFGTTTVSVVGKFDIYFESNLGQKKIKLEKDKPLHIKSDQLFMCFYIFKGLDCQSAMSVGTMMPIFMFYFTYMISVPFPYHPTSRASAFIIVVSKKDKVSDIFLDDKNITLFSADIADVNGTDYQVLALRVSAGPHYSYSRRFYQYGLYLLAYSGRGALLQHGGYKPTTLKYSDSCQRTAFKPGDLLDNDCDGLVDEDDPGVYNENDLSYGDDLQRGPAIDGGWGFWDEWTCDGEIKFHTRKRKCERWTPQFEGMNCKGYGLEIKNTSCPGEDFRVKCSGSFYGPKCDKRCPTCLNGCDRLNGTCENCRPGWTGDRCYIPCPSMTYGHDCRESCSEKCKGQDCIERRTGMCPGPTYTMPLILVFYMVIIVIFIWMCVFVFCTSVISDLESAPPVHPDVVVVKRQSSKEYTLTTHIFDTKV